MAINFFAYDQLMNQEVMKSNGFEWIAHFSVTLSAYQLVFNKIPDDEDAPEGLGLPNIEPAPSNLGMMQGVMYEMKEGALEALDAFHKQPKEYQRKVMRITRHDFTLVNAYVYIAPYEKTQTGLRSNKEFKKHLRGARKNIQMLYFSHIMNLPTID